MIEGSGSGRPKNMGNRSQIQSRIRIRKIAIFTTLPALYVPNSGQKSWCCWWPRPQCHKQKCDLQERSRSPCCYRLSRSFFFYLPAPKFPPKFLLDLFVMRGYSKHCSCANSEKIQIKGGQCYFFIYILSNSWSAYCSSQLSQEAIRYSSYVVRASGCQCRSRKLRLPNTDPDPLTQLNPDPIRNRIRISNPGRHSPGFDPILPIRTATYR